jgi:hypothetical protein
MASIIALDLIKSSMRLINAIAVGETPTADESIDSLRVLNDMLETWSIENLTVFSTQDQTFTFTPNTAVYTIGPAGTFAGVRPTSIERMFTRYQGIDYPLEQIDDKRYSLIELKTQPNIIPCFVKYDPDFPLGTLTFWPVPMQATTVTITSNTQFTALTSTAQSLSYPPGYSRAIRYCLAVDLAAEFGLPVLQQVIDIAKSSKAAIKRNNKRPTMSYADPMLTDWTYQSYADFIAGN